MLDNKLDIETEGLPVEEFIKLKIYSGNRLIVEHVGSNTFILVILNYIFF